MIVLASVLLAGCSGTMEPPAPERDPKPVQATVVIKVPGMT
jgi:hypothetical protein